MCSEGGNVEGWARHDGCDKNCNRNLFWEDFHCFRNGKTTETVSHKNESLSGRKSSHEEHQWPEIIRLVWDFQGLQRVDPRGTQIERRDNPLTPQRIGDLSSQQQPTE
nr:hypothetical protein Iba_chr14dCG9560 [Ipomoea batatas]